MLTLALALFLSIPHTFERTHEVAVIEVNTVCNERGDAILEQVVLWSRVPTLSRPVVAAWRMRTGVIVRRSGDRYEAVYYEGAARHRIVAPSLKESFTLGDPEQENRDHFSVDRRQVVFPEFYH